MTASRRDDLVVALAAVVALAVFVVVERVVAGAPGFPLDDSWIHLHFARNLSEGAGFSYNPGVPVSGSTAPLWTVLLALGALVAGPSLAMAKVVGVATAVAAALVLRRAALAWGAPRSVGLAAAILLAWAGPFTWGALSGMEVPLAALLVGAATLALARDATAATAVTGALAALARPEAILLLPLLLLARPLSIRRALVFALAATVVLMPFVAFSYSTVGRPFPATAAAKVEGGLLGWLAGVHEPVWNTWVARPAEYAWDWVGWLFRTHPLLPLALPAVVVVFRRVGRPLGSVALALVAQPLAMALLAPYRGPSFQEGRYCTHLLPLAVLVVAVALVPSPARLPGRAPAVLAAVVGALAVAALAPAAERYAWGVQNINAMQVHLGRWVDRQLPADATLAVNDIGAIAFFSRRPIIDLVGLVTPDILPYRREGEAGVIRYLTERCPDYVIVFPAWFPQLSARTELLQPLYRVRLERNEVSGAPEMVVYRFSRCAV